MAQEITVVGNLIGDATVSVVPRAAGRLQELSVRLGDRVTRGQRIAKIEDFEIVEQVKQAEAAQEVSLATIRQREADLQLAETNVERSRSLFERQLLPKQTLDDNEARYQAALAQLDLARAQTTQSKARLDELRINLANTVITSPVNGFVSKRNVDPGAFVSQNAPVADVVDITRVRLVANVVEKDLKELETGNALACRSTRIPARRSRAHRARVAGARSGDAHGADRDRDSEPRLPAEAGDVRARRHHHADARRRRWSCPQRRRRSRRPPRRVPAAERHGGLPDRPGRHRARGRRRDSRRPHEGDEVISTGPERCATAIASLLAGGRRRRTRQRGGRGRPIGWRGLERRAATGARRRGAQHRQVVRRRGHGPGRQPRVAKASSGAPAATAAVAPEAAEVATLRWRRQRTTRRQWHDPAVRWRQSVGSRWRPRRECRGQFTSGHDRVLI